MFNRSYRERIAGREFVIPIINGRKTYASEPWMTDVIRRLLDLKQGAFIDVGVNLGQTLLKVAATDPSRDYVGFEPNPTCVDYAWKLISANGLSYKVIPAGIANETTILNLEMFRSEETDPSASTVPSFRANSVEQRPVVVVDSKSLPPGTIPEEIAVIKIDVEGGELFVIEGLMPVLQRSRPFMIVEILPASNPERLQRQEAIQRHLTTLDYEIFRIVRSEGERFESLKRIDEFGIQTDLALCDYVLAPREMTDRLASSASHAKGNA
jgi:FkbM family methyltransferase